MAGRPAKYTTDTKPRHLSSRLPAALYAALEQAAAQQQTKITRICEQALERYLDSASAFDVIDAALTSAVKAIGPLEEALPPDDPHLAHIDAIYQALGPIDTTLATLKGATA